MQTAALKKLPIGIQTFHKIIDKNLLYVDKTREILRLVEQSGCYFLSRPRRFGKSLLVSTLYEIFSGNQELFKGLYIFDKIEWKRYPIIHIDFSVMDYATEDELRDGLIHLMAEINEEHHLGVENRGFKAYFYNTFRKLHEKYGEVVVLIDEYDKPIVDYVDDIPKASAHRDILKDFYLALKGCDKYLRFIFITGVSKFSRVSVFSVLNNLQDITLSPGFATLLGYTQDELESFFDGYIRRFRDEEGISRADLLEKIRKWYNGYSWNVKDRMYNPFSILNLFEQHKFGNYWFATGTPTFLMKMIKNSEMDVTEFENKFIPEIVFESYDIENMNIFALLFQTGYLTITSMEEDEGIFYTLNYPNLEVKKAFLIHLFECFSKQGMDEIQPAVIRLKKSLENGDAPAFMKIIRAMFARIPYPLHIKKEAYYHSLFYMILALMGARMDLEVLTDKGRIDATLEFENRIYIVEFKYGAAGVDMKALTDKAIRQIREKGYEQRFLDDPRRRFLLRVGFAGKATDCQLAMSEG